MSDPAIELSGVMKRFGSKVALESISLRIEEGQCYGLIGPNGAGKTTTFSLICGYLFPNAGEISVLGVKPQRPGALKRKVGVLPQDAALPAGWKVGALLEFWAELSGLEDPTAEAKTALDRVGLSESWETSAQALSHGMAKRIAFAQALIGRTLLRELKGKHTLVVSSHNLQELEELCDAAAILDRGRLIQSGSMAELTSMEAEFRIQIAQGDVPLAEIRGLRGVTSASLNPSGVLTIRFDSNQVAPEKIITEVVALLAARGVLILSVSRGRRLEERVLQLT
jgi:ABC-type multidrug transport system ATPase subunit